MINGPGFYSFAMVFAFTISSNCHAQLGGMLKDLKSLTDSANQQLKPSQPVPSTTTTQLSQQAATTQSSSGLQTIRSPGAASSPPPASAPVRTTTGASTPPLANAGGDVTGKNLKITLEMFDKKYKNNYWRSEDNLDIEVGIVKGSPNTFRITSGQIPKGYSLIEITCSDTTYASVVRSLPSSNTKRTLFTQYWEGMPDTESESGKPRFIINAKNCDISAPGMR